MCGICGSLSVRGAEVDPKPVERMLRAMVHRGPDSQGTFSAPGLVAGIRRLRVIDLATGDQPIANEDGSVEVVFNGEVYNYRELRAELERAGHRFRTRSDTEVLVHLWEDEGPAMLHRVHGMFALCLHDRRTGETFLARDRLGIKPLFWHHSHDTIVFASEPGVLLAHPAVSRDVDADRLLERFVFQYVPGHRTVFRAIDTLPPGHCVHVRDGCAAVDRWWELPRAAPRKPRPVDEVASELRALVDEAVRERTVADVPVGMFLSGGVDSSIVLSALATATSEPVRTYAVGFDGPAAFDERRFARRAAERFGAVHHELVVSAQEIGDRLPRLVERTAEPVTDPALIPTWLLSEFARREVTVVLTGEGADELFAGYRRYRAQHRWGWLGRIPGTGVLGRTGAGVLGGRRGQALQAVAEPGAARNHLRWTAIVGEDVVDRLFGRGAFERVLAAVEPTIAEHFTSASGTARSRLDGQLRADRHEWLPHLLLDKVDRASMAHSLEARTPFLDHRVVAFAADIPDDLRVRGAVGKWILRRAYRDVVPSALLDRPKRGFDLPLDDWMRGSLRPVAVEAFSRAALARWPGLDADAAMAMLDDHLAGRRDLGLALFNVLSIVLFLRGVA